LTRNPIYSEFSINFENMFYQVKNIPDSVKDVSESTRTVKVAISHTGSLDLDGDVIDPGAFTKTIAERGPAKANLIWHLTDHNPSLKSAVGKFKELYMDNGYLVGVTEIPNTTWGNDVLEFYKSGHINQHSIGFRTIKSEQVKGETPYNLIKEILLYEGSSVLWGANPNTPTLGKGLTKEDEAKELSGEMEMLVKSLRNGSYTDNAFELIETRLKQIQQRISELTTQPVQVTVEPDNEAEKLKEAIQLLTIKHFG